MNIKSIKSIKSTLITFAASAALATTAGLTASHGTTHAATFNTDQNGKVTATVQNGDAVSKIAETYNANHANAKTSVAQIIKDNKLTNNGNTIYVGDKLVIRPAGSADVTPAAPQQVAPAQQTTAPIQNTYSAPQQNNTQAYSVKSHYNTQAPVSNQSSAYTSNVSGGEAAAKAWIAQRESGGSYTARNGQYIGKYQLSAAYLNGDYSAANQERVADQYAKSRYGGWTQAMNAWRAQGWW